MLRYERARAQRGRVQLAYREMPEYFSAVALVGRLPTFLCSAASSLLAESASAPSGDAAAWYRSNLKELLLDTSLAEFFVVRP